jgi:hypothetical protein
VEGERGGSERRERRKGAVLKERRGSLERGGRHTHQESSVEGGVERALFLPTTGRAEKRGRRRSADEGS